MTIVRNTSCSHYPVRYVIPDTRDCYTGSFAEFYPFCPKLYYFSNFKDFDTMAPA